MDTFKVAEIFSSINGEGRRAGQLSTFVRFCGCNLSCSFCDTKWANEKDAAFTLMTAEEICERIEKEKTDNVTVTGGEPLMQPGIQEFLRKLAENKKLHVEIETNGSMSIAEYDDMENRPSMTLDYKLPGSGMESFMRTDNYDHLKPGDTVKFVCGSRNDLMRAEEIISKFRLTEKCAVYLSPVYGDIDPADMVEYMKEHQMNGVNLQLQLHKFIWDPMKRGV